ncbi:LruC domain-containing protein [Thalassotalea psychrophila]|uniref:LruC domain-containing protein n=1 Tax=Thalassotalea psychrophila TaxID=3065647 RepID=A0ABY9TP97_9GAMM|nr:LruC domain-containing protein [Colwelliaceae bacterium SQ149]
MKPCKHNLLNMQIANTLSTIILLLLCFSVFVSAYVQAVTQDENGNYVWSFLSGSPWPLGYDQNTGKPDDLIWAKDEYPADFFTLINNALPESEVNEAFLTGDAGSTITIKPGVEEAEIFITFIHEGAGYKNSFGFFVFDPENPPTSPEQVNEIIIFPNLSFPHLTNGHRVSLGTFSGGTSIGFFLAANAFWYDSGVKPTKVPYYYSLTNLNDEPNSTLQQHMVALYEQGVEEVILGFEDLPRSWGDNDFNDAVFSVKVTPASALQLNDLIEIPDINDSDADGILDDADEFPDDYNRAFSSFYPNVQSWVTLAFEDNWPHIGDYDLNDLIIRERLQVIYNSDTQITGFKISGFIDARGAAFHNGFALRLLDIPASALLDSTLIIGGQSYEKTAEQYQQDLVISLWSDTHVFTETSGSGKCKHFNTVAECNTFPSVPFELDVNFSTVVDSLLHSSLDFFIYRTNNRSREIHFAGYPPTDLFDITQFGKGDDSSVVEQERYFKTDNNLPWAIKIDTAWSYPKEYIDIIWAYPVFETWVESSGIEAPDWYINPGRPQHTFNP